MMKFGFQLLMLGTIHAMQCPYQVRKNGTCCKPIECGKDFQYRLCNETVSIGRDWCEKCKANEINPHIVDTKDEIYSEGMYSMCYIPMCECTPEARLVDEMRCKTEGYNECRCDTEKGYWGEDPHLCLRVNESVASLIRRPGFELTISGSVEKCKVGTFKSNADMSACKSHTRCQTGEKILISGNSMSDTICESVPPVRSTVPVTVGPTNADNTSSPEYVEDEGNILSGPQIQGIVIGVILLPVIFLAILWVYFYYKYWKYNDYLSRISSPYADMGFISYLRHCGTRRRVLRPEDGCPTRGRENGTIPNGVENVNQCIFRRNQQRGTQSEETVMLQSSRRENGLSPTGRQNNSQACVNFLQQNGQQNNGESSLHFPQQNGTFTSERNYSNRSVTDNDAASVDDASISSERLSNNQRETSGINSGSPINSSRGDAASNLSDNASGIQTVLKSEDNQDKTSSLSGNNDSTSPYLKDVESLGVSSMLSCNNYSTASQCSSLPRKANKASGAENGKPVATVRPIVNKDQMRPEVNGNVAQATGDHDPCYRPYINGQFVDNPPVSEETSRIDYHDDDDDGDGAGDSE